MGYGLSVVAIPAADYPQWRERLSWHVHSFAERSNGGRSVETIEASIAASETQCWAVVDEGGDVWACALTYIAQDDARTCIVLACAGKEFARWFGLLLHTLNAWRHELGSKKMEIHARPGWEKFLRNEGARKTHVIMEMP